MAEQKEDKSLVLEDTVERLNQLILKSDLATENQRHLWLFTFHHTAMIFSWVLPPLTCEFFKSRDTWSCSLTLTWDVVWCLSLRGLSINVC